jgi:hypothetical protein
VSTQAESGFARRQDDAARDRTASGDPARRVALMRAVWSADPVKVAVWLWIGFAVAVTGKTLIAPAVHTNYPCFESAARCWWAEQNMYDLRFTWGCYRYGPAFTVAFAPLALLPTWLGGLLWTWLNLAACFLSARDLARWVLPGQWTRRREGVFLTLVLVWSARMIWAAQSNPLVLALVAWAAVAVVRRRWWAAAFLLAVPVHIKVWPLAAALLAIACWPRRLGWRFAVAMLAVAAIPLATRSPHVVATRYQEWLAAMAGPMQERHVYRDAWTIWELIHAPVDPAAYAVLQLGAAAGALALCLWQKRRGATTPQLLTFLLGIWVAFQLIFGPGTERNTFGILAPLAGWAAITAWTQRRGRLMMGMVALLTLVAAKGQVERALVDVFPWVLAAHPIGVLLFAVWLVGHASAWNDPHRLGPPQVPSMRRAA